MLFWKLNEDENEVIRYWSNKGEDQMFITTKGKRNENVSLSRKAIRKYLRRQHKRNIEPFAQNILKGVFIDDKNADHRSIQSIDSVLACDDVSSSSNIKYHELNQSIESESRMQHHNDGAIINMMECTDIDINVSAVSSIASVELITKHNDISSDEGDIMIYK